MHKKLSSFYCSINSPSLSAVNSMNSIHRSATASPSVSASIARSSFVSTGHHNIHQAMDNNIQADVFEPIKPDICLQHIWTDNQWWAHSYQKSPQISYSYGYTTVNCKKNQIAIINFMLVSYTHQTGTLSVSQLLTYYTKFDNLTVWYCSTWTNVSLFYSLVLKVKQPKCL